MIPRTLSEWTLEVIQNLLAQRVFESDMFDFKETLPKDDNGKRRIRKACAAFANSRDGGFLVFGIEDDKAKPALDRLKGLPATFDFPQSFGNHPQQCHPTVEWSFRNPPVALSTGNVVHVIHIPQSWRAPHAVGDHQAGLVFPKRTNQGDESMSYQEIQQMFLGYYEKRLKLQLLQAELRQISSICELLENASRMAGDVTFSMVDLDVTIIQTVLSDTYSILSSEQVILNDLATIRSVSRQINNMLIQLRGYLTVPIQNQADLILEGKAFIGGRAQTVKTAAINASNRLARILLPA